MYIVGFNGPPGCGKDTMAQMLHDYMVERGVSDSSILQESLSLPLRHIAYGITDYQGATDGENYERFKRTIFAIGYGISGRQLMIDASEKFLKPCYGQDVMSSLLMARNTDWFNGVMLIRDCGFQHEVDKLIQCVGRKNFYLVSISRTDHDFAHDSREYVTHPVKTCQMHVSNDAGLDELRTEAGRIYGRLVNQLGWKL